MMEYFIGYLYTVDRKRYLTEVSVIAEDPRDAYVLAEDKLLARFHEEGKKVAQLEPVTFSVVGPCSI